METLRKLVARRRVLDGQIDAEIVKHYRVGTSIRELAEVTGLTYGVVRGVLVRMRVTLRPRGGITPQRRAARRKLGGALAVEYRQGASVQRIADAHGDLTPYQVQMALHEAGVTMRPPGGHRPGGQ